MANRKALALQRFSAVDGHDVTAIGLGDGVSGFTLAKLLMSELGIDSVQIGRKISMPVPAAVRIT